MLGCLATTPDSKQKPDCVVYLHGFPDQSVEHRRELGEDKHGRFSVRMPKKLAEFLTKENNVSFAAFNHHGVPGLE